MNCPQCRKRLLLTERPETPALKVQAHLAACEACRAFQRQLTMIESNVPRLPVPAPTSGAKAKLLAEILGTEIANHQRPAIAGAIEEHRLEAPAAQMKSTGWKPVLREKGCGTGFQPVHHNLNGAWPRRRQWC